MLPWQMSKPRIFAAWALSRELVDIFEQQAIQANEIVTTRDCYKSFDIPTNLSFSGAHGKPVMFLHPKDCNGVLVELEQEWFLNN